MAGAVVGGSAGGQLPARTLAGGTVGASPSTAPQPVPADAGPPVWQPWVAVQANALSRLKTQLTASLQQLDRDVNEAGKLLDAARAVADQETAHLEAAAWAAWHRYMTLAAEIERRVMEPALKAHAEQLEAAQKRFRDAVDPVEHAYERVKTQASYSQSVVQ